MQENIQQIYDAFYKFSVRERLLVVFAGLAGIGLIGFVTFIEPAMQDTERMRKQLVQTQSSLQDIKGKLAELQQELEQDPNQPLLVQLDAMQVQEDEFKRSLDNYTEDLLPAEQMPVVLEKMLRQSNAVKLITLESIAPKQIIEVESPDSQTPNLYQHGVLLVIEGRYFDIQQYLMNLESLPWQFYWRSFNYRVSSYPKAEVAIEIYTLSTSPAFMGVSDAG